MAAILPRRLSLDLRAKAFGQQGHGGHVSRLWTIGYEGRTPESVVDLLTRSGVHHVVDVRELPLSRKKGFSKQGLRDLLAQHRIDYTHKPELGVAKDVRDAYRRTGAWAPFQSWYRDHIDRQGPALAWLLQTMEAQPTCLLCFEEDHERCHRSLLAARLEGTGVQVLHL